MNRKRHQPPPPRLSSVELIDEDFDVEPEADEDEPKSWWQRFAKMWVEPAGSQEVEDELAELGLELELPPEPAEDPEVLRYVRFFEKQGLTVTPEDFAREVELYGKEHMLARLSNEVKDRKRREDARQQPDQRDQSASVARPREPILAIGGPDDLAYCGGCGRGFVPGVWRQFEHRCPDCGGTVDPRFWRPGPRMRMTTLARASLSRAISTRP